jgi:DNA polymerase elongation subunit (family B)
MREGSYALDYVAQKHLNEPSWGKSDFGVLTDEIKEKNINDIKRLVKLEEKYHLLEYFDEIRRLSKCLWEDLYFNSFIIEMLLFEEAKKQNIVLPNVAQNRPETTFEGATRECLETGALYGVGKYDLSSAYPSMIVNFCLDTRNVGSEGIEINGIHFKQDSTTLIPSMVNKILVLKDNLKKQIKSFSGEKNEAYTTTKIKYDAIKGVVNSTFGVMGFSSFRLYDNQIASTITYLVRELLLYTKAEIEKQGYKVIYWDTDSVFIKSEKNLRNELNQIVQNWAKTYNKDSIDIEFEYEGMFERIFILSKCRYVGDLRTSKGLIKEVKGVEMKKSNSSKYQAFFQDTLIQKVLNREHKETIELWIEQEKDRIKNLPIDEIGIPTKMTNKTYVTDYTFTRGGKEITIKDKIPPIFVRAYTNAKEVFGTKFNVALGELFYYVYVKDMGNNKKGRPITVMGFTKTMHLDRSKINYDEMIRINILTKAQMIFDAMLWNKDMLVSTNSMQLRIF